MSPQEIYQRSCGPAAEAVRRQRRALRGYDGRYPLDRTTDLLAERERVITFWKERAAEEPDKPQLGPGRFGWLWPIYAQPGFRRFVLPGVRAMLDARDKARREAFAAELREHGRQWREKKALQDALRGPKPPTKKALQQAAKARAALPQHQLFG